MGSKVKVKVKNVLHAGKNERIKLQSCHRNLKGICFYELFSPIKCRDALIWDTGCRMDKLSLSVTFFFFSDGLYGHNFPPIFFQLSPWGAQLVLNSIIIMV